MAQPISGTSSAHFLFDSITLTRERAFFSWPALVWRVRQGHVNWGDMRDVLHEVNKSQKKAVFFLTLCLGPFLSLYLFKCWREKEGTVKGLYTPHSWTLIALFTSLSVLRVRKSTSRLKRFTNVPLFLVLFPVWDWPKGSWVQTNTWSLKLPFE